MKLLFDQNISFRITPLLSKVFHNSLQVREAGLENSRDKDIWDFAKSNDYTIVTFDTDFSDFVNLYGFPPKVIWLRFGNTQTKLLAMEIENKKEDILAFINEEKFGCLELH